MLSAITRHVVFRVLFFLPDPRRKAVDRWLRGRDEYRKLHAADWLLVSWGKSGRTWLRVMLSRFYQIRFDLGEEHTLLGFDNLHKLNSGIPKVFFTHGNYVRDYTGNDYDTKIDYHGKKVVFLARDPRDVAVSQYFQWQYRMRPHKKWLNDYPEHDSEVSIYEFMMNPEVGLPRVINYFNGWLRGIPDIGDVLVIRYEDMRREPGLALASILEFTGMPATDEQIKNAVDFAAYENLKKMEAGKSTFSFWRSGWRLVPGDKSNPDSFKVRRGKVGGYRDYFSDEELQAINAMVDRDLLPQLGYTQAEQSAAPPTTASVSSSQA